MSTLSILPVKASWRSRNVRYYACDWQSIQNIIPEFELKPFSAGPDEPPNPHLEIVVRKPLSAAERPSPVGTVSHTYSLAPHRVIAALCCQGFVELGLDLDVLRYEVGLSDLGEWMNFRIYFPEAYSFMEAGDLKMDLRLECFNSVDGTSHLAILFGWYRLVCSNGLIIGKSKIELKERHGQNLDLQMIPETIQHAFESVECDRLMMEKMQAQKITFAALRQWVDNSVSKEWGKRADARVFHICDSGKGVEIDDPFAAGSATEKPVRHLDRVPGCPECASTRYDVLQAMSYVATRRKNVEERFTWQARIPGLLEHLPVVAQWSQ